MKIIRISTIPISLNVFCKGLLTELRKEGYEVVAVSSPNKELEEIAQREGVRTIAVSMERHISTIKDLKSLWRLIKVFRKEKPDLVHSITPKAGLLSMIAAWSCRVPVRLHTFTGLLFPTASGLKQKILILTDRITCACATHIVPEGEGVKNDLINFHITKKPLRVLGFGNVRGINLKYYNPKLPEVKLEATKIRKDGIFTFIFVGRIVRDKGINELVAAFTRFNAEYPDSRLILVGQFENELNPINTKTMTLINNTESIICTGHVDDVRPWLAASDALVFPSYREGFPNVVIEAGAMGLPSIVTDINGSREIIIDGKNGLIIPPKDEDKIFETMEYLISNSGERKEMAKNARPLIESRFEQGFVQKCLKNYYKEICRKG